MHKNPQRLFVPIILALMVIPALTVAAFAANDPSPPSSPVRLVFIHHSVGEYLLNDDNGQLGMELQNNNYYVSDTNYGWGPLATDIDGTLEIGHFTDFGHWYNWFQGPYRDTYLNDLYLLDGANSSYDRSLLVSPGGENKIIMFKSCFIDSRLDGNPSDAPVAGSNPLRGQNSDSEYMTVANAKGIYRDLLEYFATRQDKLFIAITSPPRALGDDLTDVQAANARAFQNWLVNDWLASYPYKNVAVFDLHNVLTSNGGNADTNDVGQATGNHHRWYGGAIQHIQSVYSNYLAYPTADSHPSQAGNRKATSELIPLLNIAYHQWIAQTVVTVNSINRTTPTGPSTNQQSVTYTVTFNASVTGVSSSNFSVPVTGITGASITSVAGSGTTWTVSVNTGAGDGTLGLNLANTTGIRDGSGNQIPSLTFSGQMYSIDKTVPAINIGSPSNSITTTGPVTFAVTYTGADAITLAAANVSLNKTGTANGTVSVTGSGNATRTVTISGITGTGTLGITIASGTAADNAGNSAAGAGPSAAFTVIAVDNPALTVVIGNPSATSSTSGPITYTVTYSGANTITLAPTNVTLNKTGTANGNVAVTGSGNTRTVTISGITGKGTLGISIAAGTATDSLGNSAPPADPSITFAVDYTLSGQIAPLILLLLD